MLTADLAQSWERDGRIKPRLVDARNADLLQTATDLIALVGEHIGERHAALDAALDEYIGTGTDYRTLRGLIKLLLDRSKFAVAEDIAPEELRAAIFIAAANAPLRDENKNQTLAETANNNAQASRSIWRAEIVAQTARELNVTPETLAENLYADLPERQMLIEFDELSAAELVMRYNLAQAQALFYRCIRLELRLEPRAAETRRSLFQTIKAYRLIHNVTPTTDGGYAIHLDGAVSLFHRSQKYGIQMAAFLPALLLHDGWQLRAEIEGKRGGTVFYDLDSRQTELETYLPPTFNFTNDTLERLPQSWAKLKTAWQLAATTELLQIGATILVPDFIARNEETGKQVYLEVLGFWTPRTLNERLAELAANSFTEFVMLASDELRGSRDEPTNLPVNVLTYKTSPDARKILAAVETLAAR